MLIIRHISLTHKKNSVLNDNYNSFLEIISFLPKHILAEFVKFLIMIVPSKKGYSFDLENVGRDIDVCAVTKNQIPF